MRISNLLCLTMVCASIGHVAANEPTTDAEAFKGKWKVKSSEFEGKDANLTYRRTFIVIEGDELYFTDGFTQSKKTKFKLDFTSNPKSIDIGEGGKNGRGIYSIDKDVLKLCLSAPGGVRPKEFKTAPGDKTNFFVLEREKP